MDQHKPLHTLIGACPIFKSLDEREIAFLTAYSATAPVAEGTVIFRTGDPAEAFFVVESGEVLIRQRQDKLRSRDVARFVDGESFGEMDVLRRSPRSAEAVAATRGTLIVVPGRLTTFSELARYDPERFAGILAKLIAYVAGRIRRANALLGKNSSVVAEIRRQVYSDKLTGLYNSTFLKDCLATFPPANSTTAAILFFKPDRFKEINDTYGHSVGDAVLRFLSQLFRNTVHSVGVPVRYRGNELVTLLGEFDREKARQLARKLQIRVRESDLFPLTGDSSIRLTASVAIAVAPDDLENGDIAGERDRRQTGRTEATPGARLFDIAVHRITQARGGPGDSLYDGSAALW